jgi:hypothetical protein
MAAVLCKGIGDLCLLPCKCCASSCKLCNDLCGGACKGCGSMCQNLCKNPFCTFVTVALFTQVPAAFLIIPELGGIPDCQGSLWLLANSVLALINVGTAFYLAYRIVDTSNSSMAHLDTAFKRASYLLCHDCWMAIYICIFVAFMCVQAWGAIASFQSFFDDEEDDECSDTVDAMVQIGSTLGWSFVILGFAALVFSMCCARFDATEYEYTEPANAYNNPDVENPNVATPPPYQANAYGNTSNTAHTQEGVPTNDFVNQPPAAGQSGTYTKDGIPTNDIPAKSGKSSYPSPQAAPSPQEEIPMAYAEEIPQQASAPPAEYDANHPTNTAQDDKRASTGGKLGEKLEQTGKKAGETLQKGFLTAKNFVKSKVAKEDDKKNQSSA